MFSNAGAAVGVDALVVEVAVGRAMVTEGTGVDWAQAVPVSKAMANSAPNK